MIPHSTPPMRQPRQSRGFTIVEMMVALVVAMILLAGVYEVYTGSKRGYKYGEAVARAQEYARFATATLGTDMRMAGYVGCSDERLYNHIDLSDAGEDDMFDFRAGTAGWEYIGGTGTATWPEQTFPSGGTALNDFDPSDEDAGDWNNHASEDLPLSLENQVLAGSDVVLLKWAQEDTNLEVNNAAAAELTTPGPTGIEQGTLLLITNCKTADVFQKSNEYTAAGLARGTSAGFKPGNVEPEPVGGTGSNCDQLALSDAAPMVQSLAGLGCWSHDYGADANTQVLRASARAYFVGVRPSDQMPTLYRIRYDRGLQADGTAVLGREEIAEGVENMQVLYGEDVNGDGMPERYVTADRVTDHATVVALKVALLIRSLEEVKPIEESNTFDLLGTTITAPDDGRLRYVVTSTVKLRNKGKR